MYWQNRMSTSLPVAALQLVDLLAGGHAGHQVAIERALAVGHPGHRRLGARGAEAPVLEPGLHHADLALLGERDVPAERADVGQGGVLIRDHAHLDGLGVVVGHVAGEADVGRVLARAGSAARSTIPR